MLTFRRALPADLNRLLAFAESTFRAAFQHLNEPEPFEQYCREVFHPDNFMRQLADPASEFWFALEDDDAVAYLKLIADQRPEGWPELSCLFVERLYVRPDRQGRRLGETMLDLAAQRAQTLQKEWLWLSVWQDTPAAVRFYERCGFEAFGTETFWLAGVPQLDWMMRRKL